MANEKRTYEEFLLDVPPQIYPYVEALNATFLENGCTVKVEMAKSGYVVSYVYTPTKRTIANFVFRKKGLMVRLYGDHVGTYEAALSELPDVMQKAIEKAPSCKRLIDPAKCSARCPMGNTFTLKDTLHKKCRYTNFFFLLDGESFPFIKELIARELGARAA